MTNLHATLTPLITQLDNWVPSSELSKLYKQFTTAQLKRLFWKREGDPALSSCCCMIGSRLYVNAPMFGLWMAGELPQQRPNKEAELNQEH